MKPSSQTKKFSIFFLLLLGPGLILIFLAKSNHHFQILPYFGVKEVDMVNVNGELKADTIYHKVPDFEFVNQDGEKVSFEDFENNIMVVDFFFTTCPSICPIMTKQMTRLQWVLEDDTYDDVQFLSHTVNPKYDTPEVLKKYALEQGADLDRWTFVTGTEEEIYNQGFEGYLLSTQQDDLAPGGFLHSSMFVLVDKNRHIRGFYDGTVTTEVDKLVTDIKMLKKEEKMRENGRL